MDHSQKPRVITQDLPNPTGLEDRCAANVGSHFNEGFGIDAMSPLCVWLDNQVLKAVSNSLLRQVGSLAH